jgi:hypothetical protein
MPPMPDALKPDIHCVRTHWIRGFIAFRLARRTRTVVLMVSAWPESGLPERAARLSAISGIDQVRAGTAPPHTGPPERGWHRPGPRVYPATG